MLRRDDTALLVIDVQEAFRPVIPGFDALVRNVRLLVEGARALDVPIVVTEQYPRGLGRTVDELAASLAGAEVLEKRAFSAEAAPAFDEVLRRLGRTQLLLCGIEAHVCVHQTAAGLLGRGLAAHAAIDAIGARLPRNHEIGVQRMLSDGVVASSVETALFELLETADDPGFREVQRLVKDADVSLEPVKVGA